VGGRQVLDLLVGKGNVRTRRSRRGRQDHDDPDALRLLRRHRPGSCSGLRRRQDAGQLRARIATSPEVSFYGDLTVDENIEFFAEIHSSGTSGRREELLEFTRLAPFRDRLAERLSGGMRAEVALACALIHTPRIISSTSRRPAVDPVSARLLKILSSLLGSGITIVMTTPYMDEAERCSRIGLLAREAPGADTRRDKALMRGTVVEIVCPEIRRGFAC